MVTHYSTNGVDSACGRSAQKLVSSAVPHDVSCKSCQRSLDRPAALTVAKSPSLAQLRSAARAAKAALEPTANAALQAAPATAVRLAGKPASAPVAQSTQPSSQPSRFSVKAAWAARLAEQGSGNRAPRGKASKGRS